MLMTDLKQLAVDAPYPALEAVDAGAATRRMRWHIAVFLAPALLVYTAIMIVPLIDTLRLALYTRVEGVTPQIGLRISFQVNPTMTKDSIVGRKNTVR